MKTVVQKNIANATTHVLEYQKAHYMFPQKSWFLSATLKKFQFLKNGPLHAVKNMRVCHVTEITTKNTQSEVPGQGSAAVSPCT